MRKLIFAGAILFGALAWVAGTAGTAQAAGAPNLSQVPASQSLLPFKAEPVAYYRYRKWHKGCYRPYWCKYKRHGHFKSCYWGACYAHKRHHHMYQKGHHYLKKHLHHYKKHYYAY